MKYQNMSEQWSFDTSKKCPKCNESSIETSYQPPIVKGKDGKTYYHCANPSCKGYHQTRIGYDDFANFVNNL